MKGKEVKIKTLIRILTACNIACEHCYVSSSPSENKELSNRELARIVDELSHFGVDSICFTGGQPTLRGEDLIGIIKYTSKKREETGFPRLIQVTTNSSIGSSYKEAEYWAENFVKAGLDRVRLSCDEWHRKFLPEEYERCFIDVAARYGLQIKELSVVKEDRKDENEDGNGKKVFALRPGGRAGVEEYSSSWSNIRQCRMYSSRHKPSEISVFIHSTKDVHICNVGVPPELSMGKILEDDIEKMLFGDMPGIIGALCKGDVAGLAEYVGANPQDISGKIERVGKCAVCSELRKNYTDSLR